MCAFHFGQSMPLTENSFYQNHSMIFSRSKFTSFSINVSEKKKQIWFFSFLFYYYSWLNHVMHTNVMVFIVLEMFASYRQYPARKPAVATLFVFNVAYIVWLHVIKYMSGKWVYPVLDVLNLPQRIGFLTFMCIFGMSFYFIGEFLNNKIWPSEPPKHSKSGAKKHK